MFLIQRSFPGSWTLRMTSQIFIDTNIPIYVAGAAHPLRAPSTKVMNLVAAAPSRFFTDAEVLQELLHRYHSVRRWALGKIALTVFLSAMRVRIEPMLYSDVERAAALADEHPSLSARDLVHLAIMLRVGSTYIVTADQRFDEVTDIERLDPILVDEWAASVAP